MSNRIIQIRIIQIQAYSVMNWANDYVGDVTTWME